MILRIKDLIQTELKQALKDRIKELREIEMEMEELYTVGFHEGVDLLEMISESVLDDIREIESLLEMISDSVLDDIREIESLLEVNHGK